MCRTLLSISLPEWTPGWPRNKSKLFTFHSSGLPKKYVKFIKSRHSGSESLTSHHGHRKQPPFHPPPGAIVLDAHEPQVKRTFFTPRRARPKKFWDLNKGHVLRSKRSKPFWRSPGPPFRWRFLGPLQPASSRLRGAGIVAGGGRKS